MMKKFCTLCLLLTPFLNWAQSPYTLISNSNVVDVRNGKILKDASVLIKDGIIEDVFTNKRMKLPPGTVVVDGTGKYVMPGMTDAHIHFFQTGGLYTRPDAFNFTHLVPYSKDREFAFNSIGDLFRRYLRMGITTVADVGGPFDNFKVRDSIASKELSPTVLVTGPLFSMVKDEPLDNGDAPIIKTTSVAEADALFDKMIARKPDYIKIWYIVTPELPADKTFPVVQHIAKRTHEAKLKLCVHATELKTATLAVDAGADILVHSVDDEVIPDSFIQKLVAKKVSYIPTLVVVNGYVRTSSGKLKNHPNDLSYANPFAYGSLTDPEHLSVKDMPARMQKARANKNAPTKLPEDSIMAINLKKAYKGGVNVVAGTDAGNVGTMHASSFIIELEAMKAAGLTNAEVLKTATLNSAACFGQNTGVVEKGRKADLLVLPGNPLESLNPLTSAEYVIKSGKVLKADTLIHETTEMLIQRQLNAYNARDIEAFLATYSDDIELYDFPTTLIGKGKTRMREIYAPFFNTVENLHCQVVNRIKLNNTIIDQEHVRFGDKFIDAVAIYDVKDGKIVKVTFKN